MGDMRESIGAVTGSVKTLVAVGIAFAAVGTAVVGGGFSAAINLYEKIGAVETSIARLEERFGPVNAAIQAWASPPPRLKRDRGWRGREGAR